MYKTLRTSKYRPPSSRKGARDNYRLVLFALTIIAVLVFLKVWQKVNVDHQYRFNGKLQTQLSALEGENSLLEARIEELRSRERLIDLARKELHLVPVPTLKLEEKSVLDKLSRKLENWQR